MSLGETLDTAVSRLTEAGVPDARLDAELLLAHVLGDERWRLRFRRDEPMSADRRERFDALIDGRAARRPVSRLLGAREFWSLDFAVDDAVLDPRPDSEVLVQAALAAIGDHQAALRIVDLGVGSGCLLLALLSELPNATGLGIDRSSAATRTARANAAALGLSHRASFVVGDWGAALTPGGFDLAVTNPPYIAGDEFTGLMPEVARGDPRLALDGGADGLEAYRALAPQLVRLLRAQGSVVVEHGTGQSDAVRRLLDLAGLDVAEPVHDLAGHKRCLVATPRCRDAIDGKITLGMRPQAG
ncbi:MAG: peptide chain release factor N(5)-glutamine methyltransferase [Alphaproteobacteria bacterium]